MMRVRLVPAVALLALSPLVLVACGSSDSSSSSGTGSSGQQQAWSAGSGMPAGNAPVRLGALHGLQEQRGGDQHLVHVEVGQHEQVVVAPAGGLRVLGEFGPHLLGEPGQLVADGLPDGLNPAMSLTGDEADVCGVLA